MNKHKNKTKNSLIPKNIHDFSFVEKNRKKHNLPGSRNQERVMTIKHKGDVNTV